MALLQHQNAWRSLSKGADGHKLLKVLLCVLLLRRWQPSIMAGMQMGGWGALRDSLDVCGSMDGPEL